MIYRPDIDGLRAVAVGVVVAFHYGVTAAPGGFVGVDVFFVISGYLLTAYLLTPQATIADFYVRRVRRIVPALLVVIALCVPFGLLVMMPGDLELFGRSALYAIGALANVFFYFNTGYFDPASHTMPLLHTWSLSLEEQFYLLWPLIVWCARGNRKRMAWTFAALGLASFAAGVVTTLADPIGAFYLPHGRVWELIAGGCLALLPPLKRREWLALPGLALIGAAVCFMPEGATFATWHVLLPVAGAVLVIAGGTRALELPPLVFLGRISYSLYLYHWPVLVLWSHYRNFSPYTKTELVVMPLLTLLLASLSWRYVEQPFRKMRATRAQVLGAMIGGQLAIGAVAAFIVASGGLRSRVPDALQAMRSLDVMWEWRCPPGGNSYCLGGALPWNDAKARAIVWGDSNADHFFPILDAAARSANVALARVGGCSPAIRLDMAHDLNGIAWTRKCDGYRQEAMQEANRAGASLVILASAWQSAAKNLVPGSDFEASLRQTVKEFSGPRRRVVIIAEIPKWNVSPVRCVVAAELGLFRTCWFDPHKLRLADYFDQHQRATQEALARVCAAAGCEIVFPVVGLCQNGECVTSLNGEYLYRDGGHLRRNLKPRTLDALATRLGFVEMLRSVEH